MIGKTQEEVRLGDTLVELNLTAFHYLQATAFFEYVPVEEIIHIQQFFRPYLNDNIFPYSREGAFSYLEALEASGFLVEAPSLDELIFRRLLVSDLRKSLHQLSKEELQIIQDSLDAAKTIERLQNIIREMLSSKEIYLPSASIKIVKSFPLPFADRSYSALTLDAGDYEVHGVEPGIYIRAETYSPIFIQPLILHEFIHLTFGERHPMMLCRGLEEGICEFIGSLYMGAQAIGWKAAVNSFVYSRLRSQQPEIWSLYLQMTRQAYVLYRHYGWAGLSQIIREGRQILKEVERSLWCGQYEALPLERGDWDDTLSRKSEWLLDIFSRQMSLSPGAYLIRPAALIGTSAREISSQFDLPIDFVMEKLNELSSHTRILTLRADQSVIAFSDAGKIFAPYEIRYRLPA